MHLLNVIAERGSLEWDVHDPDPRAGGLPVLCSAVPAAQFSSMTVFTYCDLSPEEVSVLYTLKAFHVQSKVCDCS